jgi:hypothetical protein
MVVIFPTRRRQGGTIIGPAHAALQMGCVANVVATINSVVFISSELPVGINGLDTFQFFKRLATISDTIGPIATFWISKLPKHEAMKLKISTLAQDICLNQKLRGKIATILCT